MPLTLRNLAFYLAVLGLGAGNAHAQESGLFSEFKLRTGLALGTAVSSTATSGDDHLTRRTLGAGLNLGYQFGKHSISAEFGYQYKPGDQYLVDITQTPRTLGLEAPNPAFSVDSRKNTLSGVTLRVSYERTLDEDWSLRGGVQLGGGKYRHEYIGDVTDGATYENTYNGTPTKSSTPVSPFVGATYRFNPASSLELNLISVAYTSIYNVHTLQANAHGADALQASNRRQVHFEIGYVFRF
jgi:hypothetical protein